MILPKTIDINKSKAAERKKDIDEGLTLARRIDELRKMRVDLEVSFEVWRKGQYSEIQKGIDQLIEERDNLKRQNDEARVQRDKLLEPLNREWQIVQDTKKDIIRGKNELFLDRERFDKEVLELKEQRKDVQVIALRVKRNEKQTEKARNEAFNLKQLAKDELELARHDIQRRKSESESILKEVYERKKEYEVGIETVEIREKQVDEKDAELLIRERELDRRVENLKRVEQIKENG